MMRRIFLSALICISAGRALAVPQITVLDYNVSGNGVADWSTNSAQVKAIGREIQYLNPDIITFQEIPLTNTWQMANWVKVFMPGFYLATNSGTDGYIRSTIASRFPINRSTSWMSRSNLAYFGYNGSFTRDLFEAEIAVPGFSQPLHVFTTHLKSGSTTTDALRRAAEAAAISNFLVTVFLPGNAAPYFLTGDMNEDIARPTSAGYLPIQTLTSAPTGLRLTSPVNPVTGTNLTISIQTTLDARFDYIMPCGALFSNLVSSQVFRTDLLTNFSSNLFSNDDLTASDHLPVVMTFANPFNTPFRLLAFCRTNQTVWLKWESATNRVFSVETSGDLAQWTPLATNLFSTGTNFVFTTNQVSDPVKFFRIYRVP